MGIDFEYRGRTVNLEMKNTVEYCGEEIIILAKTISGEGFFKDKHIIGYLSELEEEEHEKVVNNLSGLITLNGENVQFGKIEHLGEIEKGLLASLVFYE